MLCVTHLGKFVMQATIWIEKNSNSHETFAHVSGLLVNQKRIEKMESDVQTKFLKVIEDIAWVNNCTTILFSTRVLSIEDFLKYGYQYASESVHESLDDP